MKKNRASSPALPSVYLASKSPRRRELLSQIGVPFEPLPVTVPELRAGQESAEEYVIRLAAQKAEAGAELMLERGMIVRPVVGADTLVVCDSEVFEKPRDQQHATAMLKRLSGRTHEVLTGISLCDGERHLTRMARTQVSFRSLDDREIDAYWNTGEPGDKAGAYAIQGLGAVFVEKINGSYSNVVGLPIEQLVVLLRAFELDYWQG